MRFRLPADAALFRDIVRGVVAEQRVLDPAIDHALTRGWPLKRVVSQFAFTGRAQEPKADADLPADADLVVPTIAQAIGVRETGHEPLRPDPPTYTTVGRSIVGPEALVAVVESRPPGQEGSPANLLQQAFYPRFVHFRRIRRKYWLKPSGPASY